ncbi:hypothetical protein SACS_0689 [Parasaccharibacter apium]|uniref:CHAD domain-containing protein n=3 Tax=Acetobacterales TaxID=3120395 RepID=A0A7U7J0U7_9PROT|nr:MULTISPECIES: hypothetical protein [Acetobacteraceae]MUH03596.1 hypothetical protein [Bombella sp. ESL0387]MBE1724339.1 hypothetical protein [Bombella apis]MBR9729868.1 hypothetical protein [Bombella apis]UPO79635.1 hypothetical protein DTQ13_04215 [Parasaccharibacter sp. TMW 2.1888]CDG33427.1 hypothetical protein SACS_0689 [Parasaccharibacter apium]
MPIFPFRPSASRRSTPAFPQKMLDTVFEHVLLDDVPHPDTPLPEDVLPACEKTEIRDGYNLCWQLLEHGVDRKAFRRLILKIALSGTASKDEQLAFKYARAKFKHMRFACANFTRQHRYPLLLHVVTIIMGNMQDAFKNHQRRATLINGLILWVVLSPVYYWLIAAPIALWKEDSTAGIIAYQKKENARLAKLIRTLDATTGHEFHVMRKIISRRVAFNDTLRTIRPSRALDQLSEYLATINGMMGDFHDGLIEKKLEGTQDYRRDRFQSPEGIPQRIRAFLERSPH